MRDDIHEQQQRGVGAERENERKNDKVSNGYNEKIENYGENAKRDEKREVAALDMGASSDIVRTCGQTGQHELHSLAAHSVPNSMSLLQHVVMHALLCVCVCV